MVDSWCCQITLRPTADCGEAIEPHIVMILCSIAGKAISVTHIPWKSHNEFSEFRKKSHKPKKRAVTFNASYLGLPVLRVQTWPLTQSETVVRGKTTEDHGYITPETLPTVSNYKEPHRHFVLLTPRLAETPGYQTATVWLHKECDVTNVNRSTTYADETLAVTQPDAGDDKEPIHERGIRLRESPGYENVEISSAGYVVFTEHTVAAGVNRDSGSMTT